MKRLTNIDKGEVRAGLAFTEAVALFRAWCPEEAVIFTWGKMCIRDRSYEDFVPAQEGSARTAAGAF